MHATLAQRIFTDYNHMKGTREEASRKKTFTEVYEDFYHHKFEEDKSRTYPRSAIASCRAAFKNCAFLHDRIFAKLIRLPHCRLQDVNRQSAGTIFSRRCQDGCRKEPNRPASVQAPKKWRIYVFFPKYGHC